MAVGAGSGSVLSQGAAAAGTIPPQDSVARPPTDKQPTSPATGVGTPQATSTGTTPSLQSLYPTAPTPATFNASTGTAATTGAAPTANASNTGPVAGINGGMINPNDPTNSAAQLNAITASGSPYIQQATQQGMLTAASRGLQNSSLGAGASEAAAVAAAAPLAEENASSATGAALQNSQLQTQASEFNAGQQNANQQLNAQLETQTNQFNASQTQTANATNAAAVNAINSQTEAIIGQLNTQELSGNQAQVLAGIQGQYSKLISQNQSAASLMQSTLGAMSAMMGNQNIDQGRINTETTGLLTMLQSGLSIINQINGGTGTGAGTQVPGATPTTPTPAPIPRPIRK